MKKKQEKRAENAEKRNAENRQTAMERLKAQEAAHMQLIEEHMKHADVALEFVSIRVKAVSDKMNALKNHTRLMTSHPMFRSKAGYFNWQLSALTWICQMAVDITSYMQEELHKMQAMMDIIKEE